MGTLLGFIATGLYVIVYIIDLIRVFIVNIKRSSYLKRIDKENFTSAFEADVFGNYQYKETWNWMFCKSGHNIFGVFGETLSSAFGKGRRDDTLNGFGLVISYLLDFVWFPDWKKGGHCKASIMDDYQIKINQKSYTRRL